MPESIRLSTRGRFRVAPLAAVAALCAAAVPPSAPALTGPGTIRITGTEAINRKVDIGARGSSVGDVQFIRAKLHNRRLTNKSLGHSDMLCTYTGAGTSSCSATYFLPKGKILVSGVIGSRLFFEVAVIGGTGLYDNARGTLTVTALGGKPLQHLLIFRLKT